MDVRLPDGTIIQNVPDNMTKAELTAKLGNHPALQGAQIGADPSAANYSPQISSSAGHGGPWNARPADGGTEMDSALERALVKADAAGNVDDAKALTAEILRRRSLAGASNTDLPPGFVMDRSPSDLPEGFVLDGPSPNTPPNNAPRGGALANFAAGFNENAANVLGYPSKIINTLTAPASIAGRYVGDKLRELSGKPPIEASAEQPPESMGRLSGTSTDFLDTMRRAGIDPRNVEAQTGVDKFARGAGHGVADAATAIIPATALANVSRAGTMTNALARALASQPTIQAASSAMGEGTESATGSPIAGMAAGLGTALAGGLADNAIRNFTSRSAAIDAAPSTAELRSQGSALFNKAKGTDVTISEGSFKGLIDDMRNTLDAEGADQHLHPDISAAVNAISRRAGIEPNVQNLMTSRQLLSDAAQRAGSDNERRMASMLIDKLDDYVDQLGPQDLASGSMGTAPAELTAARDLWTRMKKSSVIEGIMNAAKDQASGEENGLRIGFRALLRNQRALRGFTPDEIDAIRDVARGTFTSNTLRRLGKLGFGSKAQSNFLGGSIGAGAGFHLGGPVGAVAVPAAGYVAQKGSEAMTRRAADYARALAASGSKAAATPSAGQVLLNPDRGANVALLAKVLAEQSRFPAFSALMEGQQR